MTDERDGGSKRSQIACTWILKKISKNTIFLLKTVNKCQRENDEYEENIIPN